MSDLHRVLETAGDFLETPGKAKQGLSENLRLARKWRVSGFQDDISAEIRKGCQLRTGFREKNRPS